MKNLLRCSSNRLSLKRVLYNPRNNFKKLASPVSPSLVLQGVRACGHTNCRRFKDCFVKSNAYIKLIPRVKIESEKDILNLNAYKRSGI